jgi:hypothetical protein
VLRCAGIAGSVAVARSSELTSTELAVLRPRCVAGRCVATQRRGARILHAAAAGRRQLLHSRLSHADQQQLALLSRLGGRY